jgi:hypothetical protein
MNRLRDEVLLALKEIYGHVQVTASPVKDGVTTISVVYGRARMRRDFYIDPVIAGVSADWADNIKDVIEHDIEVAGQE